MLFRMETLRQIQAGQVTLAFRRWPRPLARAGGTLTTAVGVLAFDAVDAVPDHAIHHADAVAAGFADVPELLEELDHKPGTIYRLQVRYAGEDPRIALRQAAPSDAERTEVLARLASMDRRTAWTSAAMQTIATYPSVPSRILAPLIGLDVAKLKPRIRKLKGLGLTESLERGYRLSPRGRAFVDSELGVQIVPLATRMDAVGPLAHHFEQTWEPYYGNKGPGDAREDVRAVAQTDLPCGQVAFRDGELAGTVALRPDSIASHAHLTPWVTGLLVLPGHRGRGIADRLLVAVEEDARRLGFGEVYVATAMDSERMRSRGWARVGEAATLRGEVPVLRRALATSSSP